jgi:hypothetical protein
VTIDNVAHDGVEHGVTEKFESLVVDEPTLFRPVGCGFV